MKFCLLRAERSETILVAQFVAAERGDQPDQFVERIRFDDISVCSAGMAGVDVFRIIGRDHHGHRNGRQAGVCTESTYELTAAFRFQIKKNQMWQPEMGQGLSRS